MHPTRGDLSEEERVTAVVLRERKLKFQEQLQDFGECLVRAARTGFTSAAAADWTLGDRVQSLFVVAKGVDQADLALKRIWAEQGSRSEGRAWGSRPGDEGERWAGTGSEEAVPRSVPGPQEGGAPGLAAPAPSPA